MKNGKRRKEKRDYLPYTYGTPELTTIECKLTNYNAVKGDFEPEE